MEKRKEETIQISAVIEVGIVAEMDAIAKAEKRSRAEIIRFAIDEYMDRHRVRVEERRAAPEA